MRYSSLRSLAKRSAIKTKVSFSKTKWTEFAAECGLPPTRPLWLDLVHFTTPKYRLSPSFHEAILENAWHWQDVYRERKDQVREAARLRLLEPVCQLN
jgi:hypothetical protein